MRSIYLILAIVGFIAPNLFVAIVSVETGNILLWLHPMATLKGMFANSISTAFVVDLLVVVCVFFCLDLSGVQSAEDEKAVSHLGTYTAIWNGWCASLISLPQRNLSSGQT